MENEWQSYDVEVTHLFGASPAQVYDAWLDPDLICAWFGPGLGQTLPVEVDASVGGKFRIVQIRDGQAVGHSGYYLVLDRPHHIAFTWAMDDDDGYSEVRIALAPKDTGTQVRLVHAIGEQWQAYEAQVKQAWSTMMAEMESLLVNDNPSQA
ncbi:SRPBCC domain-containing protein [Shewanella sp. AS1]|uniref:SRPBCC family protein n=1 Tax=Shewanella sp. AS1 TaxID=2907626 RepID=UPI001F490699|nr:SRPBCC family protein [Shewanella sp. AS1]MCE9680092.1 SRPBCC domain-containing protein [Shewanella sp. AS1]